VRVKVVKNKVAAPFRQAEFDIEFGKGISTSGCLLDLAVRYSVLSKSGAHYSYGQQRIGQGRGDAKAFLEQNPTIAAEIEAGVYAATGIAAVGYGTESKSSLLQRWNGTTWSAQTAPNHGALYAVSCATSTACTATGYNESGGNLPLAEHWNGTEWAVQVTPYPGEPINWLYGVSCTSSTACSAVGAFLNAAGSIVPLAESIH
jgi:recA bacterial DNA recombination protein